MKQLANDDSPLGRERKPKWQGGPDGKIPKKPKNQDGKQQWKDNKKFDLTIKVVKQTIIKKKKKSI